MSHQEEIRIHQDEPQARDGLAKVKKNQKKPRPAHWRFFTELELIVVRTLRRETLTSQGLANRLDIENSSTFRTHLANLVERMIITRTRNGYRLNR